jgi:hypothetical protein
LHGALNNPGYEAAAQRELGKDYPSASIDKSENLRMVAERPAANGGSSVSFVPLKVWCEQNPDDVAAFEKQMRRKVHYTRLHSRVEALQETRRRPVHQRQRALRQRQTPEPAF